MILFLQVTQRFSKDTAYVLVYKKLHDSDLSTGKVEMNETIVSINIDPPLRRDLRESVEKDNKLFLQVTANHSASLVPASFPLRVPRVGMRKADLWLLCDVP